jgi:hypothetical protein
VNRGVTSMWVTSGDNISWWWSWQDEVKPQNCVGIMWRAGLHYLVWRYDRSAFKCASPAEWPYSHECIRTRLWQPASTCEDEETSSDLGLSHLGKSGWLRGYSLVLWSKPKQSRYTPWWRLVVRYSSYSFSTSVLDGGEWSASRPGSALPRGKDPRYPLYRRLGGPQSRSGHRG